MLRCVNQDRDAFFWCVKGFLCGSCVRLVSLNHQSIENVLPKSYKGFTFYGYTEAVHYVHYAM